MLCNFFPYNLVFVENKFALSKNYIEITLVDRQLKNQFDAVKKVFFNASDNIIERRGAEMQSYMCSLDLCASQADRE